MAASNRLSAGVREFRDWSRTGQSLFEGIAAVANDPLTERTLRDFRRAEAMELAGIPTRREWRRLRPQLDEGAQAKLTLAEIHAMMEELGTRPRRPDGTRPIRMAINGFKGGSGKTMLALHVAHYLAFRGWRVLLVDSDPQGTLSRMFDFRPELVEPSSTLAAVFAADEGVGDSPALPLLPVPTHVHGLDIIPASLEMIGTDFRVAAAYQAQEPAARRFYSLVDDALARIEDDYDFVLLDTPPAFSFSALMLLWAANALLVPVPPAMGDVSATVDFCQMVSDVMAMIEPHAGVSKIWDPVVFVHGRVDTTVGITEQLRRSSASIWGENRIEEYIPHSAAFTTAQGAFRSVYEIGPGAIDSRTLRRARDSVDLLGARLVALFQERWACEAGRAFQAEVTRV